MGREPCFAAAPVALREAAFEVGDPLFESL